MDVEDLERQIQAYEQSKTIELIADQETFERNGIKVGEKYTQFPPPTNKEEALDRLENYSGLTHLASCIRKFNNKFPKSLRTLNDQLKKINNFIEEADKISTDDAFNDVNINQDNRLHYEYQKWKHGYYQKIEFYSFPSFISGNLMRVYGEYFLYKKWLEDEIIKLNLKEVKSKTFFIEDTSLEIKSSKLDITIYEKLKRELKIIEYIFKSQFMPKSKNYDYPMLHDDGRICSKIDIRSNRKLINLEKYKEHYVKRFENAKTNIVVKNELIEIRKKVLAVQGFYNTNLTDENPKFIEFIKNYNVDYSPIEKVNNHTMVVLVDDYHANNIMFGIDGLGSRTNSWAMRDFNYDCINEELNLFCWDLLLFIENFDIERPFDNSELFNLKDKLTFDIFNSLEDSELFREETTDEKKAEKVIHPERNPNVWTAKNYELFKYLFTKYYTGKNTQLMNVWFFIKGNDTKDYLPHPPKKLYLKFILESYNIKITNFDRPDNWFEKHLPILKGHFDNFKKNV